MFGGRRMNDVQTLLLRAIHYATEAAQYYHKGDNHWTICHNLALHYLNEIDKDILKPMEADE